MAISSAWLCRLGSLQKSERKGQKGPTGKNLGWSRNKTSLELARERERDIYIYSYDIHIYIYMYIYSYYYAIDAKVSNAV